MKKKLALFILMASLACTPAFGATENSVDKNVSVKDDYTFAADKAFVTLRIEEKSANEFGTDTVTFRLKITNAEWVNDPAEINATMMSGATIDIVRMGDKQLEISLKRPVGSTDEKSWWKIPIYADVTDPGVVSLEVDGQDGLVSSGVYEIAKVYGGNYLNKGYRFDGDNPQWVTIQEPQENAFAGENKFRLVLENGVWFPESDKLVGPQAILKGAVVSGIENGSISDIRRIDDRTLELTIQRGENSSEKVKGAWALPLYFTVDQFGLAKVTLVSQGGSVKASALEGSKIVTPIRYIKTVTLTLNKPDITMKQGTEKRVVALDVSPVNPAGVTLIPVRGVFEQLGATVQWNSQERTVTIVSADKKIMLHADSASASVNGKAATLSQKPLIINGRLLIPLRSVSEQLGFGVEWLEATQQITIRQD